MDVTVILVERDMSLVMDLSDRITVLNLSEDRRGASGRAPRAPAEEILRGLGVTIDVHAPAGTLGVAQQQFVEIGSAMSYNPSILILDEPTSALAQHETERLFSLLKTLSTRAVVLLYITHRLPELKEIADTVTALRNGSLVDTISIADATPAAIVHMMFGETVQRARPMDLPAPTEPFLEVRSFSRHGAFHDVTFAVKKGEVLGIAGLLGSGRTELLRAIFGADPADSGEIIIDGQRVRPERPEQMRDLGVALTPENRKDQGLVQLLSTRIRCLERRHKMGQH